MSLLLISENLALFVNKVTADDKYSLCNSETLQQPFQMQLSKKQKLFSELLALFLKRTSNFEHFEKKNDGAYRLCIFGIMDCESGD